MKINMGLVDRVTRIVVAVLIGVLYFTNGISGTLAIVLMIMAIAFVLTGLVGFCPLYLPFKLTTNMKKKIA